MVDAQFHCVFSGSFPTLTHLGWKCVAILGLVIGSRLHFFTTTLGLGWKGLLAKGVPKVHLCLMNSTIFFYDDGYGCTSFSQGLHLVICDFVIFSECMYSFYGVDLYILIYCVLRRTHFKNPKMRSHCIDNSQAILDVYLKLFILFLENHKLPMETKSCLVLTQYEKARVLILQSI